ncbi:hypothetical protein MHJ99_10110, partial [Dermabacter vaginalis]|nr:hypothetical protein [Dermabacter vaginalis]
MSLLVLFAIRCAPKRSAAAFAVSAHFHCSGFFMKNALPPLGRQGVGGVVVLADVGDGGGGALLGAGGGFVVFAHG